METKESIAPIQPLGITTDICGCTLHVCQRIDCASDWDCVLSYGSNFLASEVVDDVYYCSVATEKALRWAGEAIASLIGAGELVIVHRSDVAA